MKVQQTSNVNFGMKPKIYGLRAAASKSGIQIRDFKETRDYILGLAPEKSEAIIALTPVIRDGKNCLDVKMMCERVIVTDKDDYVQRAIKHNNITSLPGKVKAVADELCAQLKVERGLKALIDAGIIKQEQLVHF